MLVQLRGMRQLTNSVKPGSYNNLWSAGQSVAMISSVSSTSEIVQNLLREMEQSLENLRNK